jgi:hypothetical protein
MAAATEARERAAAAGDRDAINRMAKRRPAQVEIWLAVDDDAVETYRQVQKDTRVARLGKDDAARGAADKALHEARLALEDTGAVRFVLRNVGRRKYRELLESAECQPAESDHESVRAANGPNARAGWSEQFVFRLVALCAAEPAGLTHEHLAEWVEDGRLSEGEMNRLFNGAIGLHTGDRVVDLGK